MFENAVNIESKDASSFSFSATAGHSVVLLPGIYMVWTDVDCHFINDKSVSKNSTSSIGVRLLATQTGLPVRVGEPSYFSAVGTASGVFSYIKVD